MVANKFHPVPVNVVIPNNNYVLIDMGFKVYPSGMTCDITRMIPVGNPPDYMKEFVAMVEFLCKFAISSIRVGMHFSTLEDMVQSESARVLKSYLEKYLDQKIEEYLPNTQIHSLGHPVGLSVHDPLVSGLIVDNSVFAFEPAIYLKKGTCRPINMFLKKFNIDFLGGRCEKTHIVTRKST